MTPEAPANRKDFLVLARSTLRAQLRKLGSKKFSVRLPRELEANEPVEGLHLHPNCELSFQVGGVSRMHFAGQVVSAAPGDLLIIPSGMAHHEIAGAPKDKFLTLVVRFHRDGVHFHFSAYRDRPSPTIVMEEVFAEPTLHLDLFFEEATKALRGKSASLKQTSRSLIEAGIWALLEILDSTPLDVTNEHPTLVLCRKLVASRLSDPELSVGTLSKELECSPDYLSRLFHSLTSTTLSSYITTMRISYSLSLLKKSKLSIKEIACAAGYLSPGYFIRVFKKSQGITPMEYRKGITNGFVIQKKTA